MAVGDFYTQRPVVLLPQVPENHQILDVCSDELVGGALHNHKAWFLFFLIVCVAILDFKNYECPLTHHIF